MPGQELGSNGEAKSLASYEVEVKHLITKATEQISACLTEMKTAQKETRLHRDLQAMLQDVKRIQPGHPITAAEYLEVQGCAPFQHGEPLRRCFFYCTPDEAATILEESPQIPIVVRGGNLNPVPLEEYQQYLTCVKTQTIRNMWDCHCVEPISCLMDTREFWVLRFTGTWTDSLLLDAFLGLGFCMECGLFSSTVSTTRTTVLIRLVRINLSGAAFLGSTSKRSAAYCMNRKPGRIVRLVPSGFTWKNSMGRRSTRQKQYYTTFATYALPGSTWHSPRKATCEIMQGRQRGIWRQDQDH